MPAAEHRPCRNSRVDLDAWVAEQLTAFAPLGPEELDVLAVILGYESVAPLAETA